MKPTTAYHCEICGAPRVGGDWFLVTEDRGRNTLQILKWDRRLAENPGMRHVCSPAHVEELVSHWMLDNSLDDEWQGEDHAAASLAAGATDESYRLGELMLDRASFAALGERPDMLSSILDAIDGILQAANDTRGQLEEEEEKLAPVYDA